MAVEVVVLVVVVVVVIVVVVVVIVGIPNVDIMSSCFNYIRGHHKCNVAIEL